MRKIVLAALVLVSAPAFAQQSHTVSGYVRKDGTYVAPHQQTNPNETKQDNWTTRGNVNPTTGQPGTVNPYQPTQSNPYGSPYNQPHH